jgi:hypothetical protein
MRGVQTMVAYVSGKAAFARHVGRILLLWQPIDLNTSSTLAKQAWPSSHICSPLQPKVLGQSGKNSAPTQ